MSRHSDRQRERNEGHEHRDHRIQYGVIGSIWFNG